MHVEEERNLHKALGSSSFPAVLGFGPEVLTSYLVAGLTRIEIGSKVLSDHPILVVS